MSINRVFRAAEVWGGQRDGHMGRGKNSGWCNNARWS